MADRAYRCEGCREIVEQGRMLNLCPWCQFMYREWLLAWRYLTRDVEEGYDDVDYEKGREPLAIRAMGIDWDVERVEEWLERFEEVIQWVNDSKTVRSSVVLDKWREAQELEKEVSQVEKKKWKRQGMKGFQRAETHRLVRCGME